LSGGGFALPDLQKPRIVGRVRRSRHPAKAALSIQANRCRRLFQPRTRFAIHQRQQRLTYLLMIFIQPLLFLLAQQMQLNLA